MRKLICLIIIQLFSQLTITAQSLDLYVEMNDHTLKLFRGEQLNQEFFRRNANNEQELIVEQKNGDFDGFDSSEEQDLLEETDEEDEEAGFEDYDDLLAYDEEESPSDEKQDEIDFDYIPFDDSEA